MNDSGLFVIGDENAVFGFAMLGVAGQVVHSVGEARGALDAALARRALEIVLVTDEWTPGLAGDLERLRSTRQSPLIVEIPGSRQAGQRPALRAMIQQVLGVRLEP